MVVIMLYTMTTWNFTVTAGSWICLLQNLRPLPLEVKMHSLFAISSMSLIPSSSWEVSIHTTQFITIVFLAITEEQVTPFNSVIVVLAHFTGHRQKGRVLGQGAFILLLGTRFTSLLHSRAVFEKWTEWSSLLGTLVGAFKGDWWQLGAQIPLKYLFVGRVGVRDGNDACTLHIALLCPLDLAQCSLALLPHLPLELVNTSLVGCNSW